MYDIAAWWQGQWTEDRLSRLSYLRDVMNVDRFVATAEVTVSVEGDLLQQIQAEADASGISISAWMARAARAFANDGRAS